ncbi:DoxX family protein [Sphingobacterium shayense]|uniref:DoxX family protein n=1 Tax=Sphingobacterium shayense TaxID=626343 RepID=UPI0015568903|nr:DoxX family protein [Sphingobacterium shayense]NQD70878.1 DoxX family protein [Sphingobacterium shayense]
MKKRDKIIYWIATIWLSLGMVSTAIVQIIRMDEEVKKINDLGYPAYFLTIIGIWKLLGVVAVLVPKFPLLKEWAYAGFFFLTTGAIFTHFAVRDGAVDYFGPALLLVLTIISWIYRPAGRRTA